MTHEGPAGAGRRRGLRRWPRRPRGWLAGAPFDIVDHWLEHRNTVPSWDVFLQRGIVLDTVEVSADWTRIAAIYDARGRLPERDPGCLAGSAHSSHV